ncbi:MAG: hypothetical protein KIT22_07675 [Verrucomicrobiae bacterium]|nr:hypothetical protein [Verrucomicrobiae bacterium]
MPTVFLSYRHESDAHKVRVRDLAERLERGGITVILDQLAQEREFHGGGPNNGWPRWSKTQAGNAHHRVLIIASPGWFKCYEGTELAGSGLGAAAEAGVIEQRLYNTAGVNPDIRIVYFDALDPSALPLDLQRYHQFSDPAEFHDLVHWLTGVAPVTPAPAAAADWPDTPPPLSWPMADHDDVRRALEQLLTRAAPWRLLPLRGPSEAGKTHITRQILGNALRVPGLACGRFDFKGTTDVDAELRAFVQHLGVPLPPAAPRLNERLGHILDALNHRQRPVLLIFDTYEAAGEAQDWVEKQLLQAIVPVAAAWLRVVLAGQSVPERLGAPWAGEAHAPIALMPPPPEEWFAYGQPHKPGITLDFVRQVYACCGGRASLLAQLLGPTA